MPPKSSRNPSMASDKSSKTRDGSDIKRLLLDKGVDMPCPESVEIGDDIDPDRISSRNVIIHSGCKIYGSKTMILDNTEIGFEGPATIENCQIATNVELKGGFFSNAVFLDKAKCGLGSHVREGTILEEQASIAHTVALKQTILFPFVTLGSLINFCDCLMAGGTSRKNHSEVGSSYIHFNFTPSQDKATASLIGDVARGVMLNQSPIFLGGQGGIVGPCRLGYGITVAAGTIVRKDELRSNRLIMGDAGKSGNIDFTPGKYRSDKRIIQNNIVYIANLIALIHWYDQVRAQFISRDFPPELLNALREKVDLALGERINRLEAVCLRRPTLDQSGKIPKSPKTNSDPNKQWPKLKEFLKAQPTKAAETELRDQFLDSVRQGIAPSGRNYLQVVQGLDPADSEKGTRWLQNIIDEIFTVSVKILNI